MSTESAVQDAVDLLDESVYGECRTSAGVERAWSRLHSVADAIGERQAFHLVVELWSLGYHELAAHMVAEWTRLDHVGPAQARSIVETLPRLWEQGHRETITKLLFGLSRFIQPADAEITIRLPPFESTLAVLRDKDGPVSLCALVANVGQYLLANRVDRALDARDQLRDALIRRTESRVSPNALRMCRRGITDRSLDVERLRIAQHCVDLVESGGETRCDVPEADDRGFCHLYVQVRCLPCFGDWMKEHGYVLRNSGHGTWIDGSEEYEGHFETQDGRVVGHYHFHCLEAHWFLSFFRDKFGDHWDELFVPEKDREEGEKPGDFRVAVEPARISCDRDVAMLLRTYEGRYHGRIPQAAVQAYRRYCQQSARDV